MATGKKEALLARMVSGRKVQRRLVSSEQKRMMREITATLEQPSHDLQRYHWWRHRSIDKQDSKPMPTWPEMWSYLSRQSSAVWSRARLFLCCKAQQMQRHHAVRDMLAPPKNSSKPCKHCVKVELESERFFLRPLTKDVSEMAKTGIWVVLQQFEDISLSNVSK